MGLVSSAKKVTIFEGIIIIIIIIIMEGRGTGLLVTLHALCDDAKTPTWGLGGKR